MSNQHYRFSNHRGKSRAKNRSNKWLKKQLFLSFLLLALSTLWLYLPTFSSLVERYYSQSLFPAFSKILVPITSLFSFPLTLIVLVALVILAIVNLVRAITRGGFLHWLVGCLFGVSILVSWFFLAWGANYQRSAVTDILSLNTIQPEVQEQQLETLASYLLDVIERDKAELGAERDKARAIEATSVAMTNILERQDIKPPKLAKKVKYWPSGSLLTGFSASGVMLPWLIEPTVDAGLADADLVAVAAHELAHAAGFATEGDADFIGMLAALSSESPYSRYAAALRSYRTISQDLPTELKAELDARLPAIAKADWNDTYNAYLSYQAPQWLKKKNESIYNSYLQSQGIEEGIKDYSRSTQLLIQAMQKGLLPD